MKARIFRRFSLALMLAAAPFIGGCDQEQANSAPVPGTVADVVTSQPPATVSAVDTNEPPPSDTDDELANAPGKIISTPDTASTNATTNPQLTDFVKLVQAGVGESVLTAYVTNSSTPFNVSSDDILYLNDLGTPETVITAMLQKDQQFNSNPGAGAATMAPPTQPAYPNPVPPPQPYTDQNTIVQATENVPPLTPSADVEADVEQAPNTSYSYFYDSLSPYGNWINIQGYGPCWQPTAVAVNPGWQPYSDRGHWAYTDCGWCWVSDYSWGWAPFHYGRWFRNSHWGWCWAPDTVWSPAWVSWRYSDAYCGWAPLPPSACYRPGFGFTFRGRSVGFNFGFGIGVNRFVFVPLNHFHDRFPSRYRMEHREVTKIYNTTTINNRLIRGNNNTLINRGVPVDRVALATHTDIRPIHIRADANEPRSPQLGRDGKSLSVFRPALPTPKPSVAPRLAGEGVPRNPQFNLRSRVERTQQPTRTPVTTATPERRPIIANPTAGRSPENSGRNNQFNQPNVEKPGSLLMRGPNRPDGVTSRDANPGPATPSDAQRGRAVQPQTPAQPNSAVDNNRRIFNTPRQQPPQGTPQNQLGANPTPNDQRRIDTDQQRQQRDMLQQQQRDAQQQLQLQAQQERQLQQQQRQQQQQQQQQQRQMLQQQRDFQQQQQQQQRDVQQRQFQPQPSYSTPRQDPSPRVFESPRSTPEMRTVTPPSAPAHFDSGGGGGQARGGGGNSGGGGGGGGGGSGHSSGGGGGGGGGGGNSGNNNNGGGGGGGGHR